jgi:acetyl/propionyl-CoA carboxylase alpha subunit
VFHKILIANRGEIACRIARTCRRLGVATVAVYSDADAGALHATVADEAVRIGPSPVQESYLCIDRIVAVARETGADAVHPGYGLLSEKAAFAGAVRAAGLVYVGPSEASLQTFGDKVEARALAQRSGVAVPAGMQAPLPLDDVGAPASAQSYAEAIGYPLMVKAAAGGGGIGMQIVETPEQLARAVKTCADRARSAFADPRIYLERYVRSPKHVEVQGMCDAQGNAVSLGVRECSVQRRHQKIVEESPSPAGVLVGEAGQARVRSLEEAAIAIFRAAGYVGAGTCEFILDAAGDAYFLEVNARLQVEHPVTEMCTGLDLVELQLRVACGEALPAAVLAAPRVGHAIEVRVYAEDPKRSFMPQPGRLRALAWPASGPDLRVETGFRQGDSVTPYYDPLLAKIIAHAQTRDDAVARLLAALRETRIELEGVKGSAQTNLGFLQTVLTSAPFLGGTYDTDFAEMLAKGAG